MKATLFCLQVVFGMAPLFGWCQHKLMGSFQSDFIVPNGKESNYPNLNYKNRNLSSKAKNYNYLDSSKVEDRLILSIGNFFRSKVAGNDLLDKYDPEATAIRKALHELLTGYSKYKLLKGDSTNYIKKSTVFQDATYVAERPEPKPKINLSLNKGAGQNDLLTIHEVGKPGYTIKFRGDCASSVDTCLTHLLAKNDKFIAIATRGQLQVRKKESGCLIGKMGTNHRPLTYAFSDRTSMLHAIHQSNPVELFLIDTVGRLTTMSLPESLMRSNYRIDQILPDHNLLVTRRILNGQATEIVIFNLNETQIERQQLLIKTLPYVVSQCRLEPSRSDQWLLAAYHPDQQGYHLFRHQLDTLISLTESLVKEYEFDATQARILALQNDGTLIAFDLDNPQKLILNVKNARFFDWRKQDNLIVYWKQIKEKEWALHAQNINSRLTKPKNGFIYETDLRPDVPRIRLEGDTVRFVDRFNNTDNSVSIARIRIDQ
ncbi:hypothetical protein DYU11_29525 [Fibrisoma montanum]|uniref:Uncharacterized protein n=1 Tax=Fibrisoma montanum TaxID=2305895 RepID=A0A418LY29_9BACT|nr:hypothetical protein [Fibrisoma montanum]RIV18098.1 hypothetical protein DYU11_29525 [Fibrisoma montanum]